MNIIDFATRYIVPTAVGTTSTKEVLAHLSSVFNRYGAPDRCLTNHGRAVESQQFTHFMLLHGIQVHHSVAYRAASSELVERSNGTLVSVLRKLCGGDAYAWNNHLEAAALVVNTTYNTTLHFSPFALLHGYNPKLPCQRHQLHNTKTLRE